MEISRCCNSPAGNQITINVCTCHDSTAVVPCAKFCSDHCIRIEVRVKQNVHRIWIAMDKLLVKRGPGNHYDDVIMTTIASEITSLPIVYQTFYSDADQSNHQSSASLAFVWGIHRGPVNSPHKWPVTRKMFPFDDVIMTATLGLISEYTKLW